MAKKVAKKATKKVAAKKASATTKAKAVSKKVAPKKVVTTKKAVKRQPNAAFDKPLTPSPELGEVVGAKPLARTEVVKRIWAYIKKADLQDAKNRRQINCDDKLTAVFGKKSVSMFEMNKILTKHLK